MKPSPLLSWPRVLSEIWASIFVSGQTSNLRRLTNNSWWVQKERRRGTGKWGRRHFPSEVDQLTDSCWRKEICEVLMMLTGLMMVCLFSACRRTTTYRSALKWCSRSSWSSTARSKRAEEQQTGDNVAKSRDSDMSESDAGRKFTSWLSKCWITGLIHTRRHRWMTRPCFLINKSYFSR